MGRKKGMRIEKNDGGKWGGEKEESESDLDLNYLSM